MRHRVRPSRVFWFLSALALGVAVGAWLPQTPLHALATDSNDNLVIATGPLDGGVEAIFVLDSLTGDLKAGVVSKRKPGFHAQFARNLLIDFGLEQGKKPQFLMVTGVADIARAAGGVRPATGLVYVAEVTSGAICAYIIPWSPEAHNTDQPVAAALIPWGKWQFRTAGVRDQ